MTAYYNEHDPKKAAWLRALIRMGLVAAGEVDERSIEDVIPTDLVRFDQCHFFAGIGGWSYALRLAGWPDDRPVWTGSAPCQPFSTAGKGHGAADERHLWPAWHHLISQCRPGVVFGEQVSAAIGYGWLDLVHDDLEAVGYTVGSVVLPACSVGAPHIRQRLWFVAHADGWNPSAEREQRGGEQRLIETDGGTGKSFWSDCEWLLCTDDKWRPTQPGVGPLVARSAARVGFGGDLLNTDEARVLRLSGYGDSIVAPLAAEFIRAAMEVLA